METDQKLGLLAGVAAVLISAVVYFPKPTPAAAGGEPPRPVATADRPPAVAPASVGVPDRPVRPGRSSRDDD